MKFNPTQENDNVPDVGQYLNLAKASWVLENLKDSHQFRNISFESVWADYMREAEDDLRGQLHRFETGELQKPPTEALLELPSFLYSISKDDPAERRSLHIPFAPQPLLELNLLADSSNSNSSLLVSREHDNDFVFAVSTTPTDRLEAPRTREVEISMDKHRLIPLYGRPFQVHQPRKSLMILNEKGRRSTEYAFYEAEDVKKLQRALTGYRVHHDMPLKAWRINGSGKSPYISGGMLQLWQYKPLSPSSVSSPSSTSLNSAGSPLSNTSTSDAPSNRFSELPVPIQERDGGSIDYVGWHDFPNPFAEASGRRRPQISSQTQSLPERPRALSQSVRALTDFPSISRDNTIRTSQSFRSPSNASSGRVQSFQSSQNSRRPLSSISTATQVSCSSIMSPIQGPKSNGTQAEKPELPVLVVFTMCDNRYSFLHLTCRFLYMLSKPFVLI